MMFQRLEKKRKESKMKEKGKEIKRKIDAVK